MAFRGLVALVVGEREPTREEEIVQARRELDAALEALRHAREAWTGARADNVDVVRRALDEAERQLDAARVRLQRAIGRS